ncbi:hypothetical protein GCM10025298_25000 [Natronobiforma cellulositropha]
MANIFGYRVTRATDRETISYYSDSLARRERYTKEWWAKGPSKGSDYGMQITGDCGRTGRHIDPDHDSETVAGGAFPNR